MSTIGQVHWHEGLFLQPHHLQTMQRDNVEVSSRDVRARVARGEPIDGLVPAAVAREIERLGLYRPDGLPR